MTSNEFRKTKEIVIEGVKTNAYDLNMLQMD